MIAVLAKWVTYGPAILSCVGAFLVASGTLWSAYRQSNFNASIRAKNDQIIGLQDENNKILKGSDFCWFLASSPNSAGKFPLSVENPGGLPVYDVRISIQISTDNTEKMQGIFDWTRHDLGTLSFGMHSTNIALAKGNYQINISTRYKNYIETISVFPFEHSYGQRIIVVDYEGNHLRDITSPENFVVSPESFK